MINIDSSGFVCNNQYGITGYWYCYADSVGTSNCASSGIPYNATSQGMCISGTTGTSAQAFGAGLGFKLNEPAPSMTGLSYNAGAAGVLGFAITVSGSTGGLPLNVTFPSSGTTQSPSVTIPAVSSAPFSFNTLFGNAIVPFNTTAPAPKVNTAAVTDVQIAIPGGDSVAHTYNFCVTSVVPLTAIPVAPAQLASYGALISESGNRFVLEGLGPYGVQNDPFLAGAAGAVPMTVSYGAGQVGFVASPVFGATGNSPGAFPSIISGWIPGANFVSTASGGYAGGKTISALVSAKSNWAYTAGASNYDAAYDVWFAPNANPITAGSELMVWVGHTGVTPIGSQGATVTINGSSWTVSTGTNATAQPIVTYASNMNMTSLSAFDLVPFFKDAATNGRASLTSASNLLGVQAGFEVYGPGTWTTTAYSLAIQ